MSRPFTLDSSCWMAPSNPPKRRGDHVEGNGSEEGNEEEAREDQGREARCKGSQGGKKTLTVMYATTR
jgi:hypothetical protein